MTDTPKLQKTLIDQIHPEDRSHLLKTWFGSVASGNEFHAEFRIRRHDGRYRLFDSRGTPLRDETGKIVRWFGANTDIEDQK
ncbi:PAS domain-containing protein, partial [Acinetobacter baumannii]